jgi:adenine-specific DNA-methyltransferase
MRYIGNKTRLLSFIRGAIRRLGIEPGKVHDAFAGTAAVGRALKTDGWSVASSDLMTYSYVLQRAYVVASRAPGFTALARHDPELRASIRGARSRGESPLDAVARFLSRELSPVQGFVASHFAPAGDRMFFTAENASRIDAARERLERWRRCAWIPDDAYYVLLAALIEGADRVANTAGVYAAYIKRWQPNALRPFALAPERPVPSVRRCTAAIGDAETVADALGRIDLLYVDPPYNTRQYPSYYHVPELLARGWFDASPTLRGKTGLLGDPTGPDGDGGLAPAQRSAWCSRRRAPAALRSLLAATGARHVLVSYNSEGVIPDAELRAALRDASTDGRVRRFVRRYRRYRADSDREGRRYKGDWVEELLYYARLR